MRRRRNAEKWHLWYTYQDLSGNCFNMFFTLYPFDHPLRISENLWGIKKKLWEEMDQFIAFFKIIGIQKFEAFVICRFYVETT